MTPTTTSRRLAATATALALAAALTACSGGGELAAARIIPGLQSSVADGTGHAAPHDADDVRFAQLMIVHHEGALEMAGLARDEATTPEVRDLAERIAAAQEPEIRMMTGWLEEWGEDLPNAAGHGGMDHGGMDMDGMDQEEAMASLAEADGVAFDRSFLELMIAHHRGAIEMAEVQLADGVNPGAHALARAIIDAQTTEIAEMEGMLGTL